jgi:hypothetical protein
VGPYLDEPEDREESHDKTSLTIPLAKQQHSDQPMISAGTCREDTMRYQVITAVLLLMGRDVVTIGKWLQTSVRIYRDSVFIL